MLDYFYIDKKTRIKNPKSIVFTTAIEEKLVGEVLTRNNYNVEAANVANHVKGIDLFVNTSEKTFAVDVKTPNDLNACITINSRALENAACDWCAAIINNTLYLVESTSLKGQLDEKGSISNEKFVELAGNNHFALTDEEALYYNAQKNIYKSYKLVNRINTVRAIDEISAELYPAYYERYKKYFRVTY